MTEFRVPVHNVVLSHHWPPLTRKDIHKYNYTKKNSVCRCAMLCSHNIDHLWHGESAKMSPTTVTHCYSEYSLLGTSYSEISLTTDINFPYTGLYPAQGPRGKRPELESQLTSKAASSKKTTIPGFLPPARAQTSLTRVPSDSGHFPRTCQPVSLHNQHHICIVLTAPSCKMSLVLELWDWFLSCMLGIYHWNEIMLPMRSLDPFRQ